ncbi:MAG: OmpH family outer membrane protein [Taibaiella sp.]|nr:OmpH family outer membrane protein [Taibaiella sp.]
MKKVIMVLACGLLMGKAAIAQSNTGIKIAYINSAVLLQNMPERINADSALAKYTRTFQEQIEIMTKEFQTKLQSFQSSEKTMSEAMKEVKTKELQDLQTRIESTQQSAQEKIQMKKQDLYTPILEKADKAIKDVAKEKNYDYIFDVNSQNGIVFSKDEYDITNLVKTKMGIK